MISPSFLKFLVIGGLGFVIDAGLTMGLIHAGLLPLIARPPAIIAAMVFTWLANRQHTFRVKKERSWAEAARYGTVAVVAACLNYLIYSGLVTFSLAPFLAIVFATAVVAVFSYFAYKHFAFGASAQTN